MKKDAYYFPHFCNARHDRKIKRIQKDLGIEGYGIFFMLLEVLREQTDFRFPLSDVDLLADEFGTSTAKVEVIIKGYGLFNIDDEEQFFSPKLLVYLQPYLEKSERARLAARKRWGEVKELSEQKNNDANEMQMHNKCNANQNASKVKVVNIVNSSSKENEISDEKQKTASEILSNYQNTTGDHNPMRQEKLLHYLDLGIQPEVIQEAIKDSTDKDIPHKYLAGILQNCLTKGIKTMSQYSKERGRINNVKNNNGQSIIPVNIYKEE